MFWLHDKGIELARIVANSGDVKLFTDIYDPYYQFALGFYSPNCIYCQDDYLRFFWIMKSCIKQSLKSKIRI